jgi:uncharacterized OB-fold protein
MANPVPKPQPVTDPGSEPYWHALTEHKLLLKSCRSCGKPHFYPRELCPHCYGDQFDWIEATGTGEIYTYTVCHRPAGPAFAEDVPYVIAIVALDEGPQMMTRIAGPRETARIGARVRVKYQPQGDGLVLPFFEVVP